ncbi:beta-glucosidase [Cellulomonas massiliensis]|uniref:beta-glucosidase n=1 Tax=Cellulomonas massiliensis TaxID=1465811 RepID=UPI0002FC861B|nr:beta-glucosidase [Cellulomonas massiliensis]
MRHPTLRRRSVTAALATSACVAALLVPVGAASAAAPPGTSTTTGEQLRRDPWPGRQSWWDESRPATRRAQALLRQMTLEEKVDMLHGELNNYYGFYNAPIERLGIPALTMADGPAGVRIANPDVNDQQSTELPAPLALAATWDRRLAERYGRTAGDEAHRTGHNVLLAPAMDIARVAQAGRAFEAFGEDPLVSGTMGGAVTRGIQQNPVVADVKHYDVYTQETNRLSGGNAVLDERTLQEIYTRPFDLAIDQAHPGSAMCSFNAVNGVQACASDELLNQVLKEQLGFEGWVMSDYGATPSTVPAILAGLDQEMPGDVGDGACHFCAPLLAAVRAGDVPLSRVDDAVLRILRPMFGLGLFDEPATVRPLREARDDAFAQRVAERAAVLLKNDHRTLPLGRGIDSLAVIGADADTAVQGGGSSQVIPTSTVSPLEGIRDRARGAEVRFARGTEPVTSAALLPGPSPIPSDFLTSAGDGRPGLRVEYFDSPDLSGTPAVDRTEPYAGIFGGFFLFQGFNAASPHFPTQSNAHTSSIRWTGTLTAPADGRYRLAATSNGTSTVYLDDEPVLTTGPSADPRTEAAVVTLEQGQRYALRVEYTNDSPGGTDAGAAFRLGWTPPAGVVEPSITRAARLAARSDVAVVVARDYSSEGGDRPSLDLPNDQAELIRRVAAANPRTVVVLTAGGAVQTSDWDAGVPAVLHSWYGGQAQGAAIARLLFGDVNPSGRLPVTLPVDERSTPVSSSAQYPGTGLDQQFSEGVFVGYRGYEQEGIEPAYPFGHGLSYTRFDYSRLRAQVVHRHGGRSDDAVVRATVRVRNTGRMTGTETVQVYVGQLPTRLVETPRRALAGWAQVTLRPGQSRLVTVRLDPHAFAYWDVARDRWTTPAGRVRLSVGASSADIRETTVVRVGEARGRDRAGQG